uniref:Tetratricopeptide TPR_2 repeat protein n=1 Tax=Methanococcus maripaludis (strain C6 / ATCC BAA-1332) TaxID=444158 RepID=A9AB58_METM6
MGLLSIFETKEPKKMLEKGIGYYNNGKYQKAVEFFNKTISSEPKNPDAWYFKGNAYQKLDKPKLAQDSYEKALSIRPNDPELVKNYAMLLNSLELFNESIEVLKNVYEPDSEITEILGIAYLKTGRFEEALVEFDKILEKKPKYKQVLAKKGTALVGLKKFDEALDTYEKVLKISPYDTEVWKNIGNAFYTVKRYEKAIQFYDMYLSEHKNDFEVTLSKGDALRKLGKTNEALELYTKTLEKHINSYEPWCRVGLLYYDIKDYETALYYLGLANERNPLNPSILVKLARTYIKLKNYNKSLEFIEKALDKDNGYAKAWCYKGYVLNILERHYEAIDCYKKAITLNKNVSDFWVQLSKVYKTIGNDDYSKEAYENAVKLEPQVLTSKSTESPSL